MNELAGFVMALAGIITSVAAFMNARVSRHEVDEAKGELTQSQQRIAELEAHRITDRRDIILIGESLAQARSDNAIMAEAFNQIWSEFTAVTGHKPQANLDMLRRLQTIQYITGKLGPLDVEARKR